MSANHPKASTHYGLSPTFPIRWRGDVDYELARVGRIFNRRRPDRYPVAIVQASRAEHLVDAVKLAKKLDCRVSIRSGGHSWAAWSVRDNAILLDLGNYHFFEYNDTTHFVSVSPSMTGQMLNNFLESKGRMFPGGHCPDVGLGGFLLQGGMGWNCRTWGWACERVVAVDVVTVDGQLLHCDSQQNSDLYWAARGAGPGFPGLVSKFYLQTIPSRSSVRSAAYFYKKEDFRKAIDWISSIAPDYDSDTEIVTVAMTPPERNEITIMVMLLTFKNDEDAARQALQPAEDTHPPGKTDSWFMKESSLGHEYQDQAFANPKGHRYRVDNAYIRNDVDIGSALEEAFTTLPTRNSYSLWYSMAPTSRRALPNMALSMQTDHYFATYLVYKDGGDDERCQSWVKGVMERLEPSSAGAYLGDSDFQVRQPRFWSPDKEKKLMEIRRKWDPKGRFCGYLDVGDQSGPRGLTSTN